MAQMRKNAITFKGGPIDLEGPELKVGDKAPIDFTVADNGLAPVTGADLANKPRIFLAVPSLDTPVCDMEVRRFNTEASKMAGLKIYTFSMDLPFAQKRWCGAAGVDNVHTLSDFKTRGFAAAHGVFMPALGLMCRAVFVIDGTNTVRHVEYVKEATQEPNYAAALDAARKML